MRQPYRLRCSAGCTYLGWLLLAACLVCFDPDQEVWRMVRRPKAAHRDRLSLPFRTGVSELSNRSTQPEKSRANPTTSAKSTASFLGDHIQGLRVARCLSLHRQAQLTAGTRVAAHPKSCKCRIPDRTNGTACSPAGRVCADLLKELKLPQLDQQTQFVGCRPRKARRAVALLQPDFPAP